MASSVDLFGRCNRDGGANAVLYKSLKTFMTKNCEGNWTILIQARGFIVLRHRDDDSFFLKEVGTTEVARDSLKMDLNKPAS